MLARVSRSVASGCRPGIRPSPTRWRSSGLNQFDQGNLERAETYLRDALAMRRASLGDAPHPDVAENLNNLALLLMESEPLRGERAAVPATPWR